MHLPTSVATSGEARRASISASALFEGRDLILCLFQGIFPFPFFGLELFLLLPVQFGFRFGFIGGDGGGSVFAGYIDGGQLFLFLQVIIVVADIVYQRVSSEFQNPGCGLVDEITVMGNVKDGSLRTGSGHFPESPWK